MIPKLSVRQDKDWRMFFIQIPSDSGKRVVNAFLRYEEENPIDKQGLFFMRRPDKNNHSMEICKNDLIMYVGPESPLTALLLSFELNKDEVFDVGREVQGQEQIIDFVNNELQEVDFKLIQLVRMVIYNDKQPDLGVLSRIYHSNQEITRRMTGSLLLEHDLRVEDNIISDILLKFQEIVIRVIDIHLNLWESPIFKHEEKKKTFDKDKQAFLASLINISSEYFLNDIESVIKPFLRKLINKMITEYNYYVQTFHLNAKMNFFFNTLIFRSVHLTVHNFSIIRDDFIDMAYKEFINFTIPEKTPVDINQEMIASYSKFKGQVRVEYFKFMNSHKHHIAESQIDKLDIELDRAHKDAFVIRNTLAQDYVEQIKGYMKEYMDTMVLFAKGDDDDEVHKRFFFDDKINIGPLLYITSAFNTNIEGYLSTEQVPVIFIKKIKENGLV